jgi:N-acetylmuramoyl-L-alanine amidase
MTYKIVDNKLFKDNVWVLQESTPNQNDSQKELLYIVIHYTAGTKAENAISWLCNPASKASAHLVLDRDGSLTQLVSFNKCAYHAGASEYKELKGINKYSIGIEVVAAGELKVVNGKYLTHNNKIIPKEDVQEIEGKYYHKFSEAQHEALKELIVVLKQNYPTLKEVISHKDVCIPRNRKQDCPDSLYRRELLNLHLNLVNNHYDP